MPHMIVRRMRIACWIPKAIDTRSEYVILVSYTRQQRLHERAKALRHYVHVCCLSCRFSSCCCSACYKPVHVLLFFRTIMLLFLDLFCVVLLLVGCNLPKACKNQHNLWVQQGGRMYKRQNTYAWEKVTNCGRAVGSPNKLYILSFRLPAHVLKNLLYTNTGCIW